MHDPQFEFDIVDLDERSNGVPNPDRMGFWLVPPWWTEAKFPAVVSHFLRRQPDPSASTRQWFSYYRHFQTALETASTDGMTRPGDRNWIEAMRTLVGRCVVLFREKAQNEAQGMKEGVSNLRVAARGRYSTVREKVS